MYLRVGFRWDVGCTDEMCSASDSKLLMHDGCLVELVADKRPEANVPSEDNCLRVDSRLDVQLDRFSTLKTHHPWFNRNVTDCGVRTQHGVRQTAQARDLILLVQSPHLPNNSAP